MVSTAPGASAVSRLFDSINPEVAAHLVRTVNSPRHGSVGPPALTTLSCSPREPLWRGHPPRISAGAKAAHSITGPTWEPPADGCWWHSVDRFAQVCPWWHSADRSAQVCPWCSSSQNFAEPLQGCLKILGRTQSKFRQAQWKSQLQVL
jgi:hypothetical protein